MGWSRKLKYISLLLLVVFTLPVYAQDGNAIEVPPVEEDLYFWEEETDEAATARIEEADRFSDPDPAPLTPNKQDFDKQKWTETTEGLDYSGEVLQEEKKEADQAEGEERDEPEYKEEAPRFSLFNWNPGPIFQLIAIILIILLIAAIIYALIRSGLFHANKSVKQTDQEPRSLEDLEENIHESDLERALRLALEKGDFRMAIRIYYLIIIKELSVRQWINWKKDKTNGQYVREMFGRDEYQHFRSITLDFDRVWYGDVQVGENEYQLLHPRFRQFLDNLKTPRKA